jgi:hypothetical protein
MKLRILALGGLSEQRPIVTRLEKITDPLSISDFHAFVFDPAHFGGQAQGLCSAGGPVKYRAPVNHHGHELMEAVLRRHKEIQDLILRKGGLIICFLSPRRYQFVAEGEGDKSLQFHDYSLLEEHISQTAQKPWSFVEEGLGTGITILPGRSCGKEYLHALNGKLEFHALFRGPGDQVSKLGEVLATDSVGYPVAAYFPQKPGAIVCLPRSKGVTGTEENQAIIEVVNTFYSGAVELEPPTWVSDVDVPGANSNDEEIGRLRENREELDSKINILEHGRRTLQGYRKLLYGTGKTVLEPVVRRAFRLLGFSIPDPGEYQQDWDLFVSDESGRTAIGEIGGFEGPIAVSKFRQLLHYVVSEGLEGRSRKGLLIGNGFRLTPLDSQQRKDQFTNPVVQEADRQGFCLIPTTELFKVICLVLQNADDEVLKKQLRDSIFSTVGLWRCP